MLVVKRVQVHVFASRWDTYCFSIERSKEKHLSEHRFDWYRETSCPHKDRNIYACVFCAFVSLFHLSLRQRHESKNAMCTLCASCCAILLYTVQNACYTFCAWLILCDCVNCSLSPACSLFLSLCGMLFSISSILTGGSTHRLLSSPAIGPSGWQIIYKPFPFSV